MRVEKILVLGLVIAMASCRVQGNKYDYRDALLKSLIFFQGQRSGKLPADKAVPWRGNSGLEDGSAEHVDLTGGYYDAGDNVKFGLPMAFTITMLSWSVIEFHKSMPEPALNEAHQAILWGTDYLLKASSSLPSALYVQVGDANADHECWQRPEDMTTPPPVYKVTPSKPGTEPAAETAAALAASSLVFRRIDVSYSKKLLKTAVKAFEFADKHRGNYSDSLTTVICPFYCSFSGYQDELLWGAAWLYKATKKESYLNFAVSLGIGLDSNTFSWDDKLPGAVMLLAKDSFIKRSKEASVFKEHADSFVCRVLPESSSNAVGYTPGGLLHEAAATNLQFVTSTAFLLSVYARYLKTFKETSMCGDLAVSPISLKHFVRRQVNYILGENPAGMSYMVGFGEVFPKHIHHRGSSIPSVDMLSAGSVACGAGFSYYESNEANPNVLVGAVVGGPDNSDQYADDRSNFAQSEPTTYINAPLVGVLAFLVGKPKYDATDSN